LWGHLTAIHDRDAAALGIGERLYPEFDVAFVSNPDKSQAAIPSRTGSPAWATVERMAACDLSGLETKATSNSDKAVLRSPTAAASRRVWLSECPTNKAACFCPALISRRPPRMRGFQKAVRRSIWVFHAFSPRAHKSLRFHDSISFNHSFHLLSSHFRYSRRYPRRTSVKTMRYVADMRRCQYVVQRPKGVR